MIEILDDLEEYKNSLKKFKNESIIVYLARVSRFCKCFGKSSSKMFFN